MKITAKLQRKDPGLPVYVVIPGRHVQPWGLTGTTVIEGTANGFPFGRRTIKAWGKEIDVWFIEFTAPFCKTSGLSVGDKVVLELQLADTSTPEELEILLTKSKKLVSLWLALSDKDRRDAGEYIRAGKAKSTREKRALTVSEKLLSKAKK